MNGLTARQHLSLLIATFGMDGTLVVPKDNLPGSTGTGTSTSTGTGTSTNASASASPTAGAPAPKLSSRVAERNKRSSRGGT
ncbi:hypothetical protein [Streptomyces corynorhini]|uniref:Uncharacterized protein n=1 Tax=Streptomyces corynorhini TaxID=2282652 RepID=A0A370BH99_9ACTN|nr:hypothetical protein [Streptomyces corynorhini]RDG39046.1 hypothetical protein DVH02_06100 [Streptomyces corynorhini]